MAAECESTVLGGTGDGQFHMTNIGTGVQYTGGPGADHIYPETGGLTYAWDDYDPADGDIINSR